MRRLRKGSKRAAFYNEGPLVFLYDGDHAERIRQCGARVLEGYDQNCADDPLLARIADSGAILLYELFQDDEVEIEIVVAESITTEERDRLSAHVRLPTGWIRLPTGELFLDSYNTLRAGLEEPTDRGATVNLSAGDYSVTIYRCDNAAADESDYPHDVIVMRPLKRKPGPGRPAILSEATSPRPAQETIAYGTVTDGEFDGLVRFISGTDLFAVNMSPQAAEALGLQAGREISFEIADGEIVIPGVYMGDTTSEYRDALPIAEDRERDAVELARVSWGVRDDFEGVLLICLRTKRQASIPEAYFGCWIPVRAS